MRKSFEDSRKIGGSEAWRVGLLGELRQCRAVHVNGEYSTFDIIPREFISVLFGGPKLLDELNGKERELTINGFLFPQRRDEDGEFVKFDWTDNYKVLYGVPNPMMAWYYSNVLQLEIVGFKRKLIDEKKKAVSAADLLARVIPYLTFMAVVQNPTIREGDLVDSLSASGLPYEEVYNSAISTILERTLN